MKPTLEAVPISRLIANPRNPRRHSEDQINRLMASLRADGQHKPVLIRRLNMQIIAGHGIVQAATRLGWTEISAVIWDVDQATADRVMLSDNRLGDLSTDDAEMVAELLREVAPADRFATGFTEGEAAKLFGGLGETLEIREVATGPVQDDFWISVTGPLAKQALVLDRVRVLLAEFPDVTADVGITMRGEGVPS
jgi:ParB-like chromosome segregation protein Spo0J